MDAESTASNTYIPHVTPLMALIVLLLACKYCSPVYCHQSFTKVTPGFVLGQYQMQIWSGKFWTRFCTLFAKLLLSPVQFLLLTFLWFLHVVISASLGLRLWRCPLKASVYFSSAVSKHVSSLWVPVPPMCVHTRSSTWPCLLWPPHLSSPLSH